MPSGMKQRRQEAWEKHPLMSLIHRWSLIQSLVSKSSHVFPFKTLSPDSVCEPFSQQSIECKIQGRQPNLGVLFSSTKDHLHLCLLNYMFLLHAILQMCLFSFCRCFLPLLWTFFPMMMSKKKTQIYDGEQTWRGPRRRFKEQLKKRRKLISTSSSSTETTACIRETWAQKKTNSFSQN